MVQTTRNEYVTACLPGPVCHCLSLWWTGFTQKQLNRICINSAWENKKAQQLNSHFISLLFNSTPFRRVRMLRCHVSVIVWDRQTVVLVYGQIFIHNTVDIHINI